MQIIPASKRPTQISRTQLQVQRNLRASRSDSNRVSTSPSRTGPFTLRMMERLVSSMNSTRTYGSHPEDANESARAADRHRGLGNRFRFKERVGTHPEILKKGAAPGRQSRARRETRETSRGEQSSRARRAAARRASGSSSPVRERDTLSRAWSHEEVAGTG